MNGIFLLKTPADLREKLRRDFAKIEATPLNADVYFNFFLTAEHMLDWIYPGLGPKASARRKDLRNTSVYLQVCGNLATGAKHVEVEGKQNNSVMSTDREAFYPLGFYPSGHSTGYFPAGFYPEFLVVRLKGEAARELGATICVQHLARQVLAFWDAYTLD